MSSNLGHLATAVRAGMHNLEELLQVEPISSSRSKGFTQTSSAEARSFYGIFAHAEAWKQVIAPGGEISSTRPILIVSSDLCDTEGLTLEIDKDDIVINAAGQRYQVLEQIDEGDRFGVVIYTVGEARN